MRVLRCFIIVVLCLLAVTGIANPVYAINPHENPEIAQPAYSGVTLFRYYSSALDSVLAKDPGTTREKLSKMPFANLPLTVSSATDNFVSSVETTAQLVVDIDKKMEDLRGLFQQSRLSEALPLANTLVVDVSSGYSELRRAEQAIIFNGAIFGVLSEPRTSNLWIAYEGTLRQIGLVRNMLDLYRDMLADLLRGYVSADLIADILTALNEGNPPPSLPDISNTPVVKALSTTVITLTISPVSAFVGDSIQVTGSLTTGGKPLGGREVDILFNSENHGTIRTDASGFFDATVEVPFWYVPSLQVQALYYPKGADAGVYLSSLSPSATLTLLYYEAFLSLTLDAEAYPGTDFTVSGRFAYTHSAPVVERVLEIYLDTTRVAELTASGEFTSIIKLSPDLKVGPHILTIAGEANGRYAPVTVDTLMNVIKAHVKFTTVLPNMLFIPGDIDLNGGVTSGLGPLQKALVRVSLGKSMHEFRSDTDGAFQEKMKIPFTFGLVGAETLQVGVFPQEPWNHPLTIVKKVFVVNSITCSAFLLLLAIAGVILPRKLKLRLPSPVMKRVHLPSGVTAVQPDSFPRYGEMVSPPSSFPGAGDGTGTGVTVEPRIRIFSWYVLILRLAQRVARVVLKPQHTLREYVTETRKVLGPLSDYLMEFTRIVEKLLYSHSRATESDAAQSEQLSRRIQDDLKG